MGQGRGYSHDHRSGNVIPCVGAIIRDDAGRLLMIRRGHEPALGAWSLPGGRVEPGESDAQAVAREVAEETGLIVRVGALIGRLEVPAPAGGVFDIGDYTCTVLGGKLRAGDDATEVAWVDPSELVSRDDAPGRQTPPGFVETLTGWGVLEPASHQNNDGKPD